MSDYKGVLFRGTSDYKGVLSRGTCQTIRAFSLEGHVRLSLCQTRLPNNPFIHKNIYMAH